MVFYNELKPQEEGAGKLVEEEFRKLWHDLKVPNDVDLLKQLANGTYPPNTLDLSSQNSNYQRVYK